jgi:hypothetical protein
MKNGPIVNYLRNVLVLQNRFNPKSGRKTFFWVITTALVFSLISGLTPSWAGPPFFTDDPEPADHHHGEFYLATQYFHTRDGKSANLPFIDFNYGLFPNMHLHLVAPMQYVKPEGGDSQYGYGDTEIGVKFRFIPETATTPMVGTFPLIELPTGNSDKGLGNGQAQYFLPLWFQNV